MGVFDLLEEFMNPKLIETIALFLLLLIESDELVGEVPYQFRVC